MATYDSLPSSERTLVLELLTWRPHVCSLMCVSTAFKIRVQVFLLTQTSTSMCLLACRMPPGQSLYLFSCSLPQGEPLVYPRQALALMAECPAIRDNRIDPDILWYELLYGVQSLPLCALSISA